MSAEQINKLGKKMGFLGASLLGVSIAAWAFNVFGADNSETITKAFMLLLE